MAKLVYVAGPYSSDPVANTRRAVHFAELIEERGGAVFIPHLSMLWDLISPAPYGEWLKRDFNVLSRCDALFRIDGDSAGADMEVDYAKTVRVPVFLDLDALYEWLDGGPF
jgi:hypothetical protein